MSDIQRDREERQHVIEVLKSWDGYFIGYTSDEVQEALRYAIASIRTDLKYDLLYEETSGQADKPTTKNDLPCGEKMEFPDTFEEFVEQYGFIDSEEIYTNASWLIPVFRVKQLLEYISTTKNDLSSGLKNGSPIIDWNNCHTSEQLDSITTAQNDLGVDFKLKDYVSREAVRRIIKSQRTQEQMLNALNSLRNATECKAEDCINRDYTAKYVEEFANNEYVSQDEAETIYLIADGIRHIPSALHDVHDNNVGELTIHCKDCKFFEYDHFEDVFGVPLIVAHEVCTKWGDACKTNENGACFLAERKESEEV